MKVNWLAVGSLAAVAGLALALKPDLFGGGGGFYSGKSGTVKGGLTPDSGDTTTDTSTTKKESSTSPTTSPGDYTPTSFGSGLSWDQISPKIKQDMYNMYNPVPKGPSGAPLSLSSEYKAVSSAMAGYGDSGVYLSQPKKNPTGAAQGTALLPFGSGIDYQKPPEPVTKKDVLAILPATPQSTVDAFMNKVSTSQKTALQTYYDTLPSTWSQSTKEFYAYHWGPDAVKSAMGSTATSNYSGSSDLNNFNQTVVKKITYNPNTKVGISPT